MLEDGSVRLLRESGLAGRLDEQGLEHGGIYLQFAGERHHIDFRELTGGRSVTVYAQTEVVKDLIKQRVTDGGHVEFDVTDTEVDHLDTLSLQEPAHDVDGGVVPVEQAGRSHEPDRVDRAVEVGHRRTGRSRRKGSAM